MTALPLLQGHQLHTPLARVDGEIVTAGRFLAHARALADALPPGKRLINLCEDRYYFLLGFAAALLSDKTTLLPPNRAHHTLEQLCAEEADHLLLSDRPQEYAGFGCLDITTYPFPETKTGIIPAIPAGQPAAILYTSGSSGAATAHAKSWGMLVEGARATGRRLRIDEGTTLLATVPPQHMFGLETSVMLPLQCGCAIDHRRPLFPADIDDALDSLPQPRALVTTPLQLRACAESGAALTHCDFILSSTAPLDAKLAQRIEALCDTPVMEIYGSTETGAIATRAPAREDSWQLLRGYRLEQCDGGWWLDAPHLPTPQRLADQLQLEGERFTLLGRNSDLVKVAGKRVSLGELNRILLDIEGVEDGHFFLPESHEEITTRLAAVVVSNGLSESALNAQLRQRIDAAFLPRPLMLIDRLPRNEVGKLPRKALLDLLHEQQQSA